jgi:hypothetical protein
MARTNSKYFEYRKNLLGVGSAPTPLKILVGNSTTIKIGQMARVNTAGFVVPGGVGNALLGRVAGLIDNNGVPVNSFSYTGATGHTNSGDDIVVTASDNQTRALAVYAEVEVGLEATLFYNIASAALAQTNLLQYFDLVSTSDQVDQATASDSNGQLQLVQLDPDVDGTVGAGLFRINESQFNGALDTGTAKIAA